MLMCPIPAGNYQVTLLLFTTILFAESAILQACYIAACAVHAAAMHMHVCTWVRHSVCLQTLPLPWYLLLLGF